MFCNIASRKCTINILLSHFEYHVTKQVFSYFLFSISLVELTIFICFSEEESKNFSIHVLTSVKKHLHICKYFNALNIFHLRHLILKICLLQFTFWNILGNDRTFIGFGTTTTIGRRWKTFMTINV